MYVLLVNGTILFYYQYIIIGILILTLCLLRWNLKNSKILSTHDLSERYQKTENIRVLRSVLVYSGIALVHNLETIILSQYALRYIIPTRDAVRLSHWTALWDLLIAISCCLYPLPYLLERKRTPRNKAR